MSVENVSFINTCPSINFSFHLIKDDNDHFTSTLVIDVIGKYRDGTEGNDDAKLIRGILNTADDLWEPSTILLDLSELEYHWGDYIDCVLAGPESKKPFAILVGQKCRKALSTLVNGIDSRDDIVDQIDFFDNKVLALEKLERDKNKNSNG